MRIAYLSGDTIPSRSAESIFVMKMCRSLALLGNDVDLYIKTAHSSRAEAKTDPFAYYGVGRIFNINHMTPPKIPGNSYWHALLSAYRAKQSKPDLIYSRMALGSLFSALEEFPTVLELHRPIEKGRPIVAHALRVLFHRPSFKSLVVITDALRLHYEARYPSLKGRILVAADGADPLNHDVEPETLDADRRRPQVGYVGHLYEGKGAELVVEIARRTPDFDYHLIGGTETDLHYWRSRNDLPSNVRLHGHIPHAQVPSYLLAFDTLLLPNQPHVYTASGTIDIGAWTSPLKLFEYMAAGRAIVCSDVPVLQEVAQDGVNMLVRRHDNVDDWVNALELLNSSPLLRESLGKTAREQLERRYSWNRRAEYLLDHVNRLT